MTVSDNISWSQLTQWRGEYHQRFGTIHQMPVIQGPHRELKRLFKENSHVLDIGAGVDKPLKTVLPTSARYFSLDVDSEGDFDYNTFADIPAGTRFDLMWSSQVLEHVPIDVAVEIVQRAYQHLVEGGYILATVPNMAHPVRYWADATHIQHWPINDLYGLFKAAGFHVVKMARYNKYPYPIRPLKRMVTRMVCDVFRVDWCDSIMIVAQKPE